MSDKYGVQNDPYCWPGTTVLTNELGIREEARLADAEAEFAAVALERIEIEAPPFNLAYLRLLHRQLFCDVYSWAGELRSVDIAKGTTRFCTASRIAPEAEKVMRTLDHLDIHTLSWPDALPLLVECFGELNIVHPFREGNGRALRLFFEHFLVVNGMGVDWNRVQREEWVTACIAAVACDYSSLVAIFDRCIITTLSDDTA